MPVASFILLLLPAFLPATTFAQEGPIAPDRPGFGDSASTVGRGDLQVEAGYTYFGSETHVIGQLLLRYGILAGVEARLFAGSLIVRPDLPDPTRLSDAAVGIKVHLADYHTSLSRTTIGVRASTSLPTGEGPREIRPHVRLLAETAVGDRWNLSANVGYDELSELFVTTSIGIAVLPDRTLGLYTGYSSFGLPDGASHFVEGGATYLVTNDTQVDVHLGTRTHNVDDTFFVGFGIAQRY